MEIQLKASVTDKKYPPKVLPQKWGVFICKETIILNYSHIITKDSE